jgi:hypothetical protein
VELVRVVALAWPAKHVARAFSGLRSSTINLQRGASQISPTLRFSIPHLLRYGDLSAFGIVVTTKCAVFSSCTTDSMPKSGSSNQKNNICDIGASPARFKGRFGWTSTIENDQVHFRVVCGNHREQHAELMSNPHQIPGTSKRSQVCQTHRRTCKVFPGAVGLGFCVHRWTHKGCDRRH